MNSGSLELYKLCILFSQFISKKPEADLHVNNHSGNAIRRIRIVVRERHSVWQYDSTARISREELTELLAEASLAL
ncbi:hypothetical protein [Cohnella sp. OV330]|uniref:hypothetical protein n=1 Tax=Cohnella sp. OV330 TaxID=1855288 RepID=UPI001160509C|nr:hypothetical protein [Cohnella sp. OV330]